MKKRTFVNFILSQIFIFSYLLTTLYADTGSYILYTNNTNGALENCLCTDKPYGSLEKRVLYIREWLREHPNTLLLDAGDFLSASSDRLKDSIAFRIHELIQYDAIGLGDQEFFRGVDFFSHLVQDSKLPFVSTNLMKPALPNIHRELIITKGGITYGIISMIDPGVFRFYPEHISTVIEVAAYEDLIQPRIDELRENVDVIILLSHLGIDADRELARTIPGIDVIVGSHDQVVLESPEKVGESIIVQAGKNGYYVGQLQLTFDEGRNISSYEGEVIPMDISLPNDSTVIAMIIEYNRLNRIRIGTRVERINPIPSSFLVASPETCGSCHQDEFSHWLTTGHAASFFTLKNDHKEKSPNCLACHTTGSGRDDGYLNYNITAELKTVNCTECHWVTAAHLENPDLLLTERIRENRCIRCHDQENSPEFAFTAYRDRILHPVNNIILHQITEGETLSDLAKRYLGKGSRWTEIYELNRDTIEDPGTIFSGKSVKIQVDPGME